MYKFFQGFVIFKHSSMITNVIPHSPDDGSLEPKRYSVDFIFQ